MPDEGTCIFARERIASGKTVDETCPDLEAAIHAQAYGYRDRPE